MVYFQSFALNPDAIGTSYDAGLRSTSENPKRLLSVLVQSVTAATAAALLQIWYEQELIAEIPLALIDSPAAGVAEALSFNRLNEVEVGFDIPIGAVVKVALKATGATDELVGAYRYEISA